MISLAAMAVATGRKYFYARGLAIATALGVPTSSWTAGDPTRSLYHFISTELETLSTKVVIHVQSAFLDLLDEDTYDRLVVLADQVYGVTATPATFATCAVTLTNDEGGEYTYEPGDITVRNSSTGKTYHNTSGGTLLPGDASPTAVLLDFVADEAGSDSSAAVGEIDEMVTVDIGVTCANATAAVGIDRESVSSIKGRCRDKLGALSPNGPRDAYSYVARSTEFTGTSGITRVRVFDDSDTGDVLMYVAGPSGAVSSDDLAAATIAVVENATPLCITPTVANASNVTVNVTATLWVYESDSRTDDELEEAAEERLEQMFAEKPIRGDLLTPDAATGYLYKSHIASELQAVSRRCFRVNVTAPVGDTALTGGQVAAVGTVTLSITRVADP